MTVYVDELQWWGPSKLRIFKEGSSHLTADTLDELHAFANRIGMRRAWFQDHSLHPHYDLTKKKRAAALLSGAIFVPAKEQAALRIQRRRIVDADRWRKLRVALDEAHELDGEYCCQDAEECDSLMMVAGQLHFLLYINDDGSTAWHRASVCPLCSMKAG